MNLNRTGRVGALCWLVAAPIFLVASLVTGLRWREPAYSWATHNISDLGNAHCGIWDTTSPRYVCSPWHPLMNAATLTTAVLLAAGLLLTWRSLGRGPVVRSAQTLLLLAAGGYALAARLPGRRRREPARPRRIPDHGDWATSACSSPASPRPPRRSAAGDGSRLPLG